MSDLDLHRRLLALERAVDDVRAREQGVTPHRVRFLAAKTASQTIPANAWTVVTWPTVAEDTISAYNASAHTLSLPAGWYICACTLFWSLTIASGSQEIIMSLDRNGARLRDGARQIVATSNATALTTTWLVSEGDYRIMALHGPATISASILGSGSGYETWWHVWRVA